MNDQELEQLARGLGTRAGDRIDVKSVASAVVERLRSQPARPWWRRTPIVAAGAAAAVLVLAFGLFWGGAKGRVGDQPTIADALAPAELTQLSALELQEVIDSLVFDAPVHEIAVAGLADLNEVQLQELLQLMEG